MKIELYEILEEMKRALELARSVYGHVGLFAVARSSLETVITREYEFYISKHGYQMEKSVFQFYTGADPFKDVYVTEGEEWLVTLKSAYNNSTPSLALSWNFHIENGNENKVVTRSHWIL